MTQRISRQQRQDEFFKQRREQLRNWPYTIHQIDDTLDISLIEGLGKQLLFKAIQSRNLTAFAGTGLSISYGRLGWRAWQTEQQRIARANANSFIKLSEAALELMRYLHDLVQPKNEFPDKDDKSLFETDPDFPELWKKVNKEGPGTLADEKFTNKHWEKTDLKPVVSPKHWGQPQRHNVWRWLRSRQSQHDFALRQIEGLFQTFKKTQDGEGQFPGGEEMPVKFEVAQQLHTELHQHVSLFLPMLNSGDQHDEKREQERKEDAWFGSRATTGNGAPLGALYVLKWFLTKRHGLKDKLKELHEEYEKRFEDFSTRMNRAEARLSFETLAKVLLVDECPHAALHLREGVLQGQDPDDEKLDKELRKAYTEWLEVEDELKVFTTDNLKRNPDGIRKRRERYKVLTPFKLENFEALMEKTAPGEGNPWQHLHNVITTALAHYRATKGERNYLSPSARFMVAAYLARRDDAVDWLTREEKKDLQSPFRTDFMNRSSLMDRQQDPLHKAVTDLGVRHYVTTNYDFEIERFFEDSGYRRFPATIREPNERNKPPSVDDFRADDIGGVLKDQSFSQDMAADMVTFAVNQQSHDASVYHLHGRATKEDNLVITERDYMELYLSSGPKRDTADEGISLIFSGVPLLFLGLGMNETDLLRPLRQFISNRDRTIGYTSIALLPADSGIDARTKFSSALYLRYGVHTIFYGSGTMRVQGMHSNTGELFSVPDQDKNDRADRRGLDWMHRILKLIGALKEVTKAYIGDEGKTANEFTSEAQIYEFIRKQVGQVQDDLADKDIGYEADGWALETLLGVRYELAPDLPKRDDFETDKAYGDAANAHHKAWDKELVDRLTDQVPNESEEDKGRTIRIAHCDFTPTRPKNAPNPHSDDEPPVNSKEYLEDECAMLTELLAMTLKLPVTSRCPGLEKDRDLRARVIFLNGLDGAIRTGCMNAAIAAITKEQRQWWQRFQQSPPHRVARFQELPHQPDPHTRHEPRRYVRHNVDGVITNLEELDKPVDLRRQPIRDREDPGRINQHPDVATRVRTFDTFIAAVDANFSRRHLSPNRRVLITVAALRGTGKGTFLSAFSSRRGLALYAKAAWGNYPYVQLSGAIFINLSFATEIGSVFDMLINAINAEALQFDPQPDSEEVKEIKKHTSLTSEEREEKIAYVQSVEHDKRVKNEIDEQEVGVSRLRRLRSAIKRYTDASNNAAEHGWQVWARRSRLLIQIGAIDLLFDGRGKTKNLEIEQFLGILFGPETEDAPIDIVFSGSEIGLGYPWTAKKDHTPTDGEASPPRRILLNRDKMPVDAEENVERRLTASGIREDTPPSTGDTKIATHFIHFARPVSATTFLIDNFPTLATALFLAAPPDFEEKSESYEEYEAAREKARNLFKALLPSAVQASDSILTRLWQREELPEKRELQDARDIVRRVSTGLFPRLAEFKKHEAAGEKDEAFGAFWEVDSLKDVEEMAREMIDKIATVANASKLAIDQQGNYDKKRFAEFSHIKDWRDPLNTRVRSVPHRDEWQEVRKRLADSRFSMTILLAMAEHIVVHAPDPVDGGRQAANFIIGTVERGRNFGAVRRDEFLLETVLLGYREFHKEGDPDLDCDLHQLILRHLGAMGAPQSAPVLVRLPDFREYFSRIGVELDYSRRRFIVRALTTLAYRGLIFRLDPHPRLVRLAQKDKSGKHAGRWDAALDFRYALHRVVQSFAVAKLNVGSDDPIRLNSFGPTLYSSMPSAGPRLAAEPYRFLRSLLLGLSQYPDISNTETGITPWLFTTEDRAVRVQALRAALCLVRSNLSVAIVSRLHQDDFISQGLQKRGYLETYKVRLRWIVRLAWELLDDEDKRRYMKPDGDFDDINALYRDEIVWLYNELGVVSLAQGALSDGLGFLRQAAEFNEHIEGRSRTGPNYLSVSLNHAIIQLERGRLSAARARLETIANVTRERRCVLHHSAEGYLCVVDHLTGRHEDLAKRFENVARELQEVSATRASALILSHRARFLIDFDTAAAKDSIKRATLLAETGGHEDVRHICNLIETRIGSKAVDGVLQVSQSRALSVLRDIDVYSTRMSIWSLQCECLMHRAALLLEDGETATAGRLLMRAIALAQRNSMGLRLNRALTLYALVLLHRGDRGGATRVASTSLEMAKSSGYNLETTRAQQVLTEAESRASVNDDLLEPRGVLF